jgi:hypothetical protein
MMQLVLVLPGKERDDVLCGIDNVLFTITPFSIQIRFVPMDPTYFTACRDRDNRLSCF